jgi:hypothetical protein
MPAALLLALLAGPPAPACTFCGGGLANRQTLREHYTTATVVLHGHLRNAKVDATGVGGTTELHVEAVLKTPPGFAPGKVVVLRQYYPLVGDTPTGYVLFGGVAGGGFDAVHGVPATAAGVAYLRAAAALPADPARRLAFAFAHLDAADASVSADAFLEFAKASDADILRAKAALDPARLKRWLADPAAPADRLGVYALMLGACGTPADAKILSDLTDANPLPERAAANLAGLLAGRLLLDPAGGWAATEAALAGPGRPFGERLAAVNTVRFVQATRPDLKPAALGCLRAAIRQGDLADLAIDDLRRWGWWELTADVLAKADGTTTIVRRAVVRYAVACPAPEAKRFVEAARAKEPKLVADVEESVRLFGSK